MTHRTSPPIFMNLRTPSPKSIKACMRLTLGFLGLLRYQTGGLFFKHLQYALRTTVHQGVQQYHGDRYNQALYGGHQRLGDTASHGLRVARTENRDRLERDDHTGHGSEQTQQRRYSGDDLQKVEANLDRGALFDHGFVQFELQRLHIQRRVLFVHFQDTTQRVVGVRGRTLELCVDSRRHAHEYQHSPDSQQQTERTDRHDDVAHQATLVEAFHQARAIDERRQERTTGRTGRVDTEAVEAFGRLLQVGSITIDSTAGLARQYRDGCGGRVILQIVAVGRQVEAAHTQHFLLH